MANARNSGTKPPRDPRGHSLRIYGDVYDSHAFKSLSPRDVMAYLALLRELKGFNNGDLSLPLSRAKSCGISHHLTLARSLRALCAVGLIAVTRKGGCTKGGQRLANLYRVTDRECYEIPAKHLTAMKDTNEWKAVTSIEHGQSLIAAAEVAAKATHEKKALGHGVTVTRTPRDVVSPITRTRRDTWPERPGHGVTMAEKAANPSPARVPACFSPSPEKASHRTPHVPPLYIATRRGLKGMEGAKDEHNQRPQQGIVRRSLLNARHEELTRWLHSLSLPTPSGAGRMQRAHEAQQRAIDRHRARRVSSALNVGAAVHHEDSLTRERDEHAHDLSAWND